MLPTHTLRATIGSVKVGRKSDHELAFVTGDPSVVYIGRGRVGTHGEGHLYNRHRIEGTVSRAVAIERFRADLRADWTARGPMRREVEALARRVLRGEHLTLCCYCAPKACHGDVLVEAIEACVAVALKIAEKDAQV